MNGFGLMGSEAEGNDPRSRVPHDLSFGGSQVSG
jgi:hypothetical protein